MMFEQPYTRFIRPGILFVAVSFLYACNSNDVNSGAAPLSDSASEAQKHLPENALKSLEIASGLTVQAMASEPLLRNPTNIDVDARGRIWVTEAYNYRPKLNGNPENPQGDRIVILEDADGDGKAERSKVFYQGSDLNAPLGVCVLGNRVLVSQSPYVWSFWDDNGDDSADRKEVLFQGIGGEQHDHGMHTFTFGPDGKLYFNFGNEGKTLKDKSGRPVLDQDGDEIGPKKYKQGMVFRCNPDGTEVECLGNNFRNNYEVAVDSYGTMWQSDNDDDGNKGVRINYVMDYGNYGFTDEMTGAGWQAARTNKEDSTYQQHWHLNDPGVVPNLLQTGSGSPTGMVVYEGSLLPSVFRGQMIHCEPGHNVVRAYPVEKDGAGYKARIENILHDTADQWFRPADVCVAPDGSLIVADWYDPGVGGHAAGDQDRGRIYRIAPSKAAYKTPTLDVTTTAGAIAALQSPNLATRYLAWQALQKMGATAVPELEKLWRSGTDGRMRARAFWVLVKMPGGEKYIAEAVKDSSPEIRIVALRAARQLKKGVVETVTALAGDSDAQVRRECALALRHLKAPEAARLWASLAAKYDGRDRWQLEALGIGADRQWEPFFAAYAQGGNDVLQTPAARDLVWRSRSAAALPLLSRLAMDSSTALKARLRYFRAFDFHPGASKSQTLLGMLAAANATNTELNLLLRHLNPDVVRGSKAATAALATVLTATYGTPAYLDLVRQYKVKTETPRLVSLVFSKWDAPEGPEAVRLLIESGQKEVLAKTARGGNADSVQKFLSALGNVGYYETIDLLQNIVLSNKYSEPVRLKAAEVLGKSYGGEDRVVDLLRDGQVPEAYIPAMVGGMKNNVRQGMYKKALAYMPGAKGGGVKPVPAVATLMSLKGDAKKGQTLFQTHCALCHQVRGEGKDFGPKLSEIGSKLPREALYKSIINPSSAISFGYETTELRLKNGTQLSGIVASKTESDLELKLPGGNKQSVRIGDVKNMKQLPESAMPAFHETLSNQELADVVHYLTTLTKK